MSAGDPPKRRLVGGRSALCERLVRVYRSGRRQEMYLYVDAAVDLARVPEALLARFGRPVEAMSLLLAPDRPLARADAAKVLECIEDDGFYLQMPPATDWLPGTPENRR